MNDWMAWKERKETKTADLGVNLPKNCQNCAHCTWIIVKNRFEKTDEYYCHRVREDGQRVARVIRQLPENCKAFQRREKYAQNQS